jgi:DNA-binding beta-propeller fold protein YncE
MGSRGGGDGQLNEPNGVAVDENGNVWIADTWNNRIVEFFSDGRFQKAFADPDKPLFGPRGAVFSRGSLYVTDTGNKRVLRFDRDGRRIGEWGSDGNQPGQFVEPVGITADASGRIAVADTGNHRVQVFDPDGKFVREFRVNGWKDFYTEPHLAIGPSDSVLVTDSWGARCASYDANGNFTRSWATDGLRAPTGIALDSFGRLYVTDRANNRVIVWSLTSVIR